MFFKKKATESAPPACTKEKPPQKKIADEIQNIKEKEKEFTLYIEKKQELLDNAYQEELAKINKEKQETEERIKNLLLED